MNPTEKYCPCCKQTKPRDAFYSHPKSKDRLDYTCQECKKAELRKQYDRTKNGRLVRTYCVPQVHMLTLVWLRVLAAELPDEA